MIAAAVSVEFNCIEDFSDTPHIQAVRMFFSAIIPEIDSPIYYYNDTLSNSIKMTACGPAGLSSEGFEMIFPKGMYRLPEVRRRAFFDQCVVRMVPAGCAELPGGRERFR